MDQYKLKLQKASEILRIALFPAIKTIKKRSENGRQGHDVVKFLSIAQKRIKMGKPYYKTSGDKMKTNYLKRRYFRYNVFEYT